MKDLKIVIIDDSAFSVAFIRNILEDNGFNVVGDAGSLEEAKDVVKDKIPALVTVDMTLPGTDGFECIQAIHEIDKNIKFIIISSMMDEELIKKAKKYSVSAYIQKPVDADELLTTIKKVMDSEELFQFLINEFFDVFKEALMDALNKMTKTLLKYNDSFSSCKEYESEGVTTIIGIIGEFSGRMLIDLSKETASALASAVFRRPPKDDEELTALLAEFTNIVAGNACSILNRKNKALGLRLAPPSILSGENVRISAPDFSTIAVKAETNFGVLFMNVGFKEGEDKWM